MNPLDEAALARLRELAAAAEEGQRRDESWVDALKRRREALEDFRQMFDPATVLALLDMVPQWRPIETAPKDGTEILVWWFGRRVIATWTDGKWTDESLGQYDEQPILWMPLPRAASEPSTEERA